MGPGGPGGHLPIREVPVHTPVARVAVVAAVAVVGRIEAVMPNKITVIETHPDRAIWGIGLRDTG